MTIIIIWQKVRVYWKWDLKRFLTHYQISMRKVYCCGPNIESGTLFCKYKNKLNSKHLKVKKNYLLDKIMFMNIPRYFYYTNSLWALDAKELFLYAVDRLGQVWVAKEGRTAQVMLHSMLHVGKICCVRQSSVK